MAYFDDDTGLAPNLSPEGIAHILRKQLVVDPETGQASLRPRVGERPRSPVPQWLIDQQKADSPFQGTAPNVFKPLVEGARAGAEMTGIPSIYRGSKKLLDDDPRLLHKGAGAAEMAIGALPGMSVVRQTAPIVSEVTRTLPRLMAALSLPHVLRTAAEREIVTPAEAGEAQAQGGEKWTPPTEAQKKNPDWVKQQQERLIEKKLYPKGAKPGYGTATEDALKAEWEMEQKAKRDKARSEALEDARLEVEREKAAAAKADADAKRQQATTAQQAQTATAEATEKAEKRKKRADEVREEIRLADADSPISNAIQKYGPFFGGIPGAILGHYISKGVGKKLSEIGEKRVREAAALMKPDYTKTQVGEKVGQLNAFYTQPGAQPAISLRSPITSDRKGYHWRSPIQRPQNLFLRNEGNNPPFWKPNPDAPQSSALYPVSKGYVANAAGAALFGTGEMAAGHFGSKWQEGKKDRAQAAMNDQNASEEDVRSAAAQRDYHANMQALWDALENAGRGTALYGGGKGLLNAKNSPPQRPTEAVAKSDAVRTQVMDANAAQRAKNAREAAKAARQKAAQQPPPGPPQGPQGQGGGGTAVPLLPLAAGPLLPDRQAPGEGSQEGTGNQAYSPPMETTAPKRLGGWQTQRRSEDGRWVKGRHRQSKAPDKGENITTGSLNSDDGGLAQLLRREIDF